MRRPLLIGALLAQCARSRAATTTGTFTITLPTGTSTFTLPTGTTTETNTFTLPTGTGTATDTFTLPTTTSTLASTFTLPTGTATTTETVTLPSRTGTATDTATLTGTFTLPTGTSTTTGTVTLPTGTATTTGTATLPTGTATTTETVTLPTGTGTATDTFTLPTATSTGTSTLTLPTGTTTATQTVTSSSTFTLPTITATPTTTFTLPTVTSTVTATFTLPTATVTTTSTFTLPTRSATMTSTFTLPTDTATITSSYTLPTGSATVTSTFTLPSGTETGTRTMTLPTATSTLTETVTLLSSTATETSTVSFPTATATATATFTLPTGSATITATVTLPTLSATETHTFTLPTVSATYAQTVTLPSVTHTATATLTMTGTFTMPTGTVTETSTITLPTLTRTATSTTTDTLTGTVTLTNTFTLPTQTATTSDTLTLPTGTATSTLTATLTDTFTLPSGSQTATSTVTLPTASATITKSVTLPTLSVTDTSTFTLPTGTATAMQTLTLPTGTATGTRTTTLPSGTVTETHTFTLPTATSTTTSTSTLPTVTQTATETFTLQTASQSPTGTLTVTLPTSTATSSATFTLPSLTGTTTVTLPTQTQTLTATHTQTTTVTLPTATTTETETFTVPSASDTASLTLPSATATATVSVTLPSSTPTVTLTLPTASVTLTLPSATATASGTVTLPSATQTATVTLPSGTASETLSATETVTATPTKEEHSNYTHAMDPPEFIEGQEVRIRLAPYLQSDTITTGKVAKAHFNASGGLEVRVWQLGKHADCSYARPDRDTLLFETSETGLSDEDLGQGLQWVYSAFATFVAPSSTLRFFICFKHSLDPVFFTMPYNGEWQHFVSGTGGTVFQSRPAALFFDLRQPTAGQFTTIRLVSREPWNFTVSPGRGYCSMATGAGGVTTSSGCGLIDNAKIVPAGAPCTYERVWRPGVSPTDRYWGSAWVGSALTGGWELSALRGLLEGAVSGGVAVPGTRLANPFAVSTSATAPVNSPEVAYLYARLPDTPGRYDLCFSSVEQRAQLKAESGIESTPVWRKLFACNSPSSVGASGGLSGCTSRASIQFAFEVPAEPVSWDSFDLSPGTWGTLRIDGGGLSLSRAPMTGSTRDGWGPAGGDWLRLVPTAELSSGSHELRWAGNPNPVGAMPGPGCWSEALDSSAGWGPGGWAEDGVPRPQGTRDLGGDPSVPPESAPGPAHDAAAAADAFASVWVPTSGQMLVCFRRARSPAWRVLPRRPTAGKWAAPSPTTATAAAGLQPAGVRDPVSERLAQMPPTWVAPDTRQGTEGAVSVVRAGDNASDGTPMDSAPWNFVRGYLPGDTVAATRGSALRIVPAARPCDWPGFAAARLAAPGRFGEVLDGGLLECVCEPERGSGSCLGPRFDGVDAPETAYYLPTPLPDAAGYRVCWRYGAWNWRQLQADARNPADSVRVVASDGGVAANVGFLAVVDARLPRLEVITELALEMEAAIVIVDPRSDLTARPIERGLCSGLNVTMGDVVRLVPLGVPCEYQSHLIATSEVADTALSPLCLTPGSGSAAASGLSAAPCASAPPAAALQATQLAELAAVTPPLWDDAVPGDGLLSGLPAVLATVRLPPDLPFAQAKLCLRQATRPNWIAFNATSSPLQISPAGGAWLVPGAGERQLLGGSLQPFTLVLPARVVPPRAVWARLVPAAAAADLARAGGAANTNRGGCAEPPGGTEAERFASAYFGNATARLAGVNVELIISLVVPQTQGEYWACVALERGDEEAPSWLRFGPYSVLDNGVRWFVDTPPTSLATVRVRLARTDAASRLSQYAFDTAPGRDAAKLVPVQKGGEQVHCHDGRAEGHGDSIHVGVGVDAGRGAAGHTDLGPWDAATSVAEMIAALPASPADTTAEFRVCVLSTFLQLRDGRPPAELRMWVEAAEGLGLPLQRRLGRGFRAGPAPAVHWELDPELAPGSSYLPAHLAHLGPSVLAGATSLLSTTGSGALSTANGFRVQMRGDLAPSAKGVLKLVRVMSPVSPEPAPGQQWEWGALETTPGCLGAGASEAASAPAAGCAAHAAACPSLVRSGSAFDAVFSMPSEPGAYVVCFKVDAAPASTPWMQLPSGAGAYMLYAEPPRLSFAAAPASPASPVTSVSVSDGMLAVSVVGALTVHSSLAWWCGAAGGGPGAPCTGSDLIRVVNASQLCPAPRSSADAAWAALQAVDNQTAQPPDGGPFRLPPEHQTAQGRYAVCLFKAADPGASLSGWVARRGLVYRLPNGGGALVGGGSAAYQVVPDAAVAAARAPGGAGNLSLLIDSVEVDVDWTALAAQEALYSAGSPVTYDAVGTSSGPELYFNTSVGFSEVTADTISAFRFVTAEQLRQSGLHSEALGAVSAPIVTTQSTIPISAAVAAAGVPLPLGAVPCRVLLCPPSRSWDDGSLHCDVGAAARRGAHQLQFDDSPFLVRNVGGECPAEFGWGTDGLRSATKDGKVEYNLQVRSSCPSSHGTLPNPCCGLRVEVEPSEEGAAVRSAPVWFCVDLHYPDQVEVNGATVLSNTVPPAAKDDDPSRCGPASPGCLLVDCANRAPCALRVQAKFRGALEYAPRGSLGIVFSSFDYGGVEGDVVGTDFESASWQERPSVEWRKGGNFIFSRVPRLRPRRDEGVVFFNITHGDPAALNWTRVAVRVSRPRPVALAAVDVTPIAASLDGTDRPPVPAWHAVRDPATGELAAIEGAHLVALAPYELVYHALDASNSSVSDLDSWAVALEVFDAVSGRRAAGNAVLAVVTDQNGTAAPENFLSAPAFAVRLGRQVPEVAPVAEGFGGAEERPLRLRFRLLSSAGCSRFAGAGRGCRLQLALHKAGRDPLLAALRTPVRVPASGIRVEVSASEAPLSDGITVTALPGTPSAGAWLQDEWHFGDAFALTDAGDGLRTRDGIALEQGWAHPWDGGVMTMPERHAMRALGGGLWGARWVLRPSVPCVRCHVSFFTSWGLGPVPGAAGSAELTWTDDASGLGCTDALRVPYHRSAPASAPFRLEAWAVSSRPGGGRALWPRWEVRVNQTPALGGIGADAGEPHLAHRLVGAAGPLPLSNASAGFGPLRIEGDEAPERELELQLRFAAIAAQYSPTASGTVVSRFATHSCTSRVTLVPAAAPAPRRYVRLTAVTGAQLLCGSGAGNCSVGGCGDCAFRVALGTGASFDARFIRAYTGYSDPAPDSAHRNFTVVTGGVPVVWSCSAGACTSAARELPSPHAAVRGRADTWGAGAAAPVLEYSYGVARLSFRRALGGFDSAPQGRLRFGFDQAPVSEPVRGAAFEVCASHPACVAGQQGCSREGEQSDAVDPAVECLRIRLYIQPPDLPQPEVAIVATTGLTAPGALAFGTGECGAVPSQPSLDAVAFYTLDIQGAARRFVLYDAPLRYTLRFAGELSLLRPQQPPRLLAPRQGPPVAVLAVNNSVALNASADERTLAGRGGVVRLEFSPTAEVAEEARAPFQVSITPLGGQLPDGAVAEALTAETYYFPLQNSTPESWQWRVHASPRVAARCSPSLLLAALSRNYREFAPLPGRGWRLADGARVNTLVPVQAEVQAGGAVWERPAGYPGSGCAAFVEELDRGAVSEAACRSLCESDPSCTAIHLRRGRCSLALGAAGALDRDASCQRWLIRRPPRAWAFPPSLVRLRKVYGGGCGTGGTMRVFVARGTPVSPTAEVLAGNVSAFAELPRDADGWVAQRTVSGVATFWVMFSAPCQLCHIHLDLCYSGAVSAGDCFVGAADLAPLRAARTVLTAPFSVTPSRPTTVAVTEQSMQPSAEQRAAVGQQLQVELHTVQPFAARAGFGGWAMDAVEAVRTRVWAVSEWHPAAGSEASWKYGNGGFLAPATSDRPCALPKDDFLSASRAGVSAQAEHPTSHAGRVSLSFTYTRPCSYCKLRLYYVVEGWSQHGQDRAPSTGSFLMRSYGPRGGVMAAGEEMVFRVRTCGARWLAVSPPQVRRREGFAVAAWRVDPHGSPVWEGNASVEVSTGPGSGNGGGGELEAASPSEQKGAARWLVPAAGGSAVLRVRYTRACFSCSINIAGASRRLTVLTDPSQVLVTRMSGAEGAVYSEDSTLALTFEFYAADDVGDRAYGVGGPTPLAWLPPHEQRPAQAARLVPSFHPAEEFELGVSTVTTGAPAGSVVAGEAILNGIPYGSLGGEAEDDGAAGVAVVLLRGSPGVAVRAALQLGGTSVDAGFPTRLFGSAMPPTFDWPPVPNSAAVVTSWSGSGLSTAPGVGFNVTVYAVRSARGSDTLVRSTLPVEGNVSLRFDCSACPGCGVEPGAGTRQGPAGELSAGFSGGVAVLRARFSPGSAGLCALRLLPPSDLLLRGAFGAAGSACGPNGCNFSAEVGPVPWARWVWAPTPSFEPAAEREDGAAFPRAEVAVVARVAVELVLRVHDAAYSSLSERASPLWPADWDPGGVRFATSPSGCFLVSAARSSGPRLTLTGRFPEPGRCTIGGSANELEGEAEWVGGADGLPPGTALAQALIADAAGVLASRPVAEARRGVDAREVLLHGAQWDEEGDYLIGSGPAGAVVVVETVDESGNRSRGDYISAVTVFAARNGGSIVAGRAAASRGLARVGVSLPPTPRGGPPWHLTAAVRLPQPLPARAGSAVLLPPGWGGGGCGSASPGGNDTTTVEQLAVVLAVNGSEAAVALDAAETVVRGCAAAMVSVETHAIGSTAVITQAAELQVELRAAGAEEWAPVRLGVPQWAVSGTQLALRVAAVDRADPPNLATRPAGGGSGVYVFRPAEVPCGGVDADKEWMLQSCVPDGGCRLAPIPPCVVSSWQLGGDGELIRLSSGRWERSNVRYVGAAGPARFVISGGDAAPFVGGLRFQAPAALQPISVRVGGELEDGWDCIWALGGRACPPLPPLWYNATQERLRRGVSIPGLLRRPRADPNVPFDLTVSVADADFNPVRGDNVTRLTIGANCTDTSIGFRLGPSGAASGADWDSARVSEGVAVFRNVAFRGRCRAAVLHVRCRSAVFGDALCGALLLLVGPFEVGDSLDTGDVQSVVVVTLLLVVAAGALDSAQAQVAFQEAMLESVRQDLGPSVLSVSLRLICTVPRSEAASFRQLGDAAAASCRPPAEQRRRMGPLQGDNMVDLAEVAIELLHSPGAGDPQAMVARAVNAAASNPLSPLRAQFPGVTVVGSAATTSAPTLSAGGELTVAPKPATPQPGGGPAVTPGPPPGLAQAPQDITSGGGAVAAPLLVPALLVLSAGGG
eukprot:TRINITY_DN15369_c0_g1_i1.p1 TRINITY_DN15369_c0_g1~~TRINITY_DN15369_c0_g1_i1.p1  ORF type:complete len:5248 (+),score=1052.53 TRINITY_DN15369_c0_g1_i1:80-15745(+)